MTRISYRRSTPENWENTVKRMISLNHVKVEPAQAREIVKYLADNHGLAPSEAKAVAFESERRLVDRAYEADKETSVVCSSCHSIGRVMSERRTKQEWELLLAMHRGYYPGVDSQPMNEGSGFRRGGGRRAPEGRRSASAPRRATRWTASSRTSPRSSRCARRNGRRGRPRCNRRCLPAVGRSPDRHPARDRSSGQVVVTADPAVPDTFTTDTRFTFVRTGESVTRKGRAVVYTGFPMARPRHGRCGRRSVARSARGRSHATRDERPLVHRRV